MSNSMNGIQVLVEMVQKCLETLINTQVHRNPVVTPLTLSHRTHNRRRQRHEDVESKFDAGKVRHALPARSGGAAW